MNFFERTKLVQKVETKNDWQVPWKTVTKNKMADKFAESIILIQS